MEELKYIDELVKEYPYILKDQSEFIIANNDTILDIKCDFGHIFKGSINNNKCTECARVKKEKNEIINKMVIKELNAIHIHELIESDIKPFIKIDNHNLYLYKNNYYCLCNGCYKNFGDHPADISKHVLLGTLDHTDHYRYSHLSENYNYYHDIVENLKNEDFKYIFRRILWKEGC